MPAIWIAAASAATSLYSGYKASSAAKEGGLLANEAAQANASDIRGFGEFNASNILAVGEVNANAIIDVGEANATYIERSTERNIYLYGLQATEDVRRHLTAERQVAGDIRARASGSGIQVNTGSPLHFLNAQVDEGITQRKYMVLKHTETLTSMSDEGADKAFVTRYTADKNAEVTMANAEANASMALANAENTASQQERAGELAEASGNAAASTAMIQGVSGAVSSLGSVNWGGGVTAQSVGSTGFTTQQAGFQSSYIGQNTWSSTWNSNVRLGA